MVNFIVCIFPSKFSKIKREAAPSPPGCPPLNPQGGEDGGHQQAASGQALRGAHLPLPAPASGSPRRPRPGRQHICRAAGRTGRRLPGREHPEGADSWAAWVLSPCTPGPPGVDRSPAAPTGPQEGPQRGGAQLDGVKPPAAGPGGGAAGSSSPPARRPLGSAGSNILPGLPPSPGPGVLLFPPAPRCCSSPSPSLNQEEKERRFRVFRPWVCPRVTPSARQGGSGWIGEPRGEAGGPGEGGQRRGQGGSAGLWWPGC